MCVDDHTRATIEFTGLPHVAGVVLDRLLPGLFEDAPRGIAQSGPGEYYWYDEATTAEWTATVDRDGRTDWEFAYISVPDAVMVLDSLHIALPTAP
ncbi:MULTISPECIES: hypothetical protein [Streptomycetaceae]|uniref:hypothetical protein n=1 Tax=Streptomycetaceae TaxID=2062 RepID=UPI00059FFB5E|nr:MULTISPECIES: hypothetical protein [Streptomycetaceae]MYS57691.1 hypothetical protein [Streptomyces sp. SID5468]